MRRSLPTAVLVVLLMSAAGCGGSTATPGDESDTGASPSDTGGSGDDTGGTGGDTGTTPGDTGTTPGDTGTPPGDASPADTGGTCAKSSGTEAVHIMLNVTWKGTLAITGGSGVAHLWTRSKYVVDATGKMTAQQQPCGSMVPDITTTALAGSTKVQPEFLPAVWSSTKMPTVTVTGKVSGFAIGDTVTFDPSAVIVGATLTDPAGAWPSPGALTTVDHDGDGHPGITATPKTGGGYSQPPVDLTMSARADLLYIASRTTSAISGKRTACDATAGTATVTHFDNHVVGCHVAGGAECSAAQAKFVDDNRTVFTLGTATFETKGVADGATCDEVRAALPAK